MSFLKRTYLPGEVIVSSTPYAYVLCARENGRYCDCCFLRGTILTRDGRAADASDVNATFKRCSACKYEAYCGRQCQKAAWPLHRLECRLLAACAPKVPADSVRLLYRACRRWRGDISANSDTGNQRCDDKGKGGDPGWRSFDDLMSHADELARDEQRSQQLAEVMYTLRAYCERGGGPAAVAELPSAADQLIAFGKISTNSFSICNAEMRAIGAAVYLSPSVFDHSCVPNAVATFAGTKMNIRALRKIDTSSEQVYISYTELLAPTCERQAALWEQYYFRCQCSLCCDSSENGCRRDRLLLSNCSVHREREAAASCACCTRRGSLERVAEVLSRVKTARSAVDFEAVGLLAENFFKENSARGNYHVAIVRAREAQFDANVETGSWESAAIAGSQLLDAYKLFYPSSHPSIGVLHFMLAKLLRHLWRLEEAKQHFDDALAVLVVTHGTEHAVVVELLEQNTQCLAELFAASSGGSVSRTAGALTANSSL